MKARAKLLHLTTDSRIAGTENLLLDLAKYTDSKCFELEFATLAPRGPLQDQLEAQGFRTHALDARSIKDTPQTLSKLVGLLRSGDYDLLHSHLFHATALGQVACALVKRPITVMTRHYSDLMYLFGSPVQWRLDGIVARRVDQVIAISQGVRHVMVQRERVPARRISVIYNGIDLGKWQPLSKEETRANRSELGLKDEIVIGAVGTLHPRKGHRHLILATAHIVRNHPNARLLIVGEGVLREELLAQARALGLEDKLILAGYQTDVRRWMGMMDIFVQPSVEEGFGLTILEAMALGKPIIATNVGGIPEVIEDGVTGKLVGPADARSLSATILRCLEQPEWAKSLSEAATKVVAERFRVQDMAYSYQLIYEQLLSRNGSTQRSEAQI